MTPGGNKKEKMKTKTETDSRPQVYASGCGVNSTVLGLDFIAANGVRVRSYQLIGTRGAAVATADFTGLICTRFLYADSVKDSALKWVNEIVDQLMNE